MASKKKRSVMGRPRLSAAVRKSIQMPVSMTRSEQRLLMAEARKRGMTVSELLMIPWRENSK
jgi:hypothetical protein